MKKYCPMLNTECKEKNCAWYSEQWDECAVFSMGDSIAGLLVLLDDKYRGANINVKFSDEN